MANLLYAFGPFQLDPTSRRLLKNGEPLAVSSRQVDLLLLLVASAGQLLSKDALIEAAWAGVAVTDNSLEQAISSLRRILASGDGAGYIETQARRGYRFTAEVRRIERRETVEALEALLAPHRAWIEGRAALETLERGQIIHAREVFARVLEQVPDQASAHVGLANAGVMQYEMTRSELVPDSAALAMSEEHAREACRLDPGYGEAWATLGFVLDRTGHHADALAASRMAVSLEPDNWRHHLRLAYVSWGEERLREARRTLNLLPGFALAHWLAATVHVARHAMDAAERELTTWASQPRRLTAHTRDSAAWRFTGCSVSACWRAVTSEGRWSSSSANWQANRAASSMRASAARTPGTPLVHCTFVRVQETRRAPLSTRRCHACRCTHWHACGSPRPGGIDAGTPPSGGRSSDAQFPLWTLRWPGLWRAAFAAAPSEAVRDRRRGLAVARRMAARCGCCRSNRFCASGGDPSWEPVLARLRNRAA